MDTMVFSPRVWLVSLALATSLTLGACVDARATDSDESLATDSAEITSGRCPLICNQRRQGAEIVCDTAYDPDSDSLNNSQCVTNAFDDYSSCLLLCNAYRTMAPELEQSMN